MASRDVAAEIEARIRARGVRIAERLSLLRELLTDGGHERVQARIDATVERCRTAARAVRSGSTSP